MKTNGFMQIDEASLPEYRARGRWFRHEATGAEVYHVLNDDPENLFAIAFKTVPHDSTGVAHILEHTVLCGSHDYPVKDPFILLVKGSLNTFLNAMTYPDKTVYPASSTVEQDLFNILRVYGDAVFFPLLREEFFRQEGHRFQYDANGNLEITGIVYNEMKGNYANHDSVTARWSHRALLPDTPYGFDSGGDPASIPDLTYEAFAEFHRTFYHPSNARIFVYGDTPTERYLDFLDRHFLSRFERSSANIEIATQPRWSQPRSLEVGYQSDEPTSPTSVTTSWLLGSVTDPDALLSFELLSHILLGTSAGPLRKRLIESGLGEDLSSPTGLETDLREMIFSAGLRGVDPARREEVESLVVGALEEIVEKGIDAEITRAALRKVEFRNREIRGGGPNGLRLMGKSLRGWLHGVSPDTTLRFERPFEGLRSRVEGDARYFESLVDESILRNAHRATVTVSPDAELREREQSALAERIRAQDARMDDGARAKLREDQEVLERMQATPDDAAAVASIPFLKVGDLPRELETIPTEEATIAGAPLWRHDLYANGVLYLDLAFDLSGLDPDLIPYVPLYVDAVGELGLPGRSYDEVATAIELVSGGMTSFCEAGIPLHEVRRADRRIFFRMKALESTFEEASQLLLSVMLDSQFGNEARLADLIKEARAGMAGSVLPSGHHYAALRASRALSDADRVEEQWHGATQLLFINGLEGRVAEASRALERINESVIRRGNLTVSITGSAEAQVRHDAAIERLVNGLPEGGWTNESDHDEDEDFPETEALLVPADVAYVAAACRGGRIGTEEYVHEQVLAHLLRTGYLWEAIRMKGGAYGANASARGMDAVFSFWSYRDPQVIATLDAYRASLEHFAKNRVDDDDLELAVIGVTGQHIRPLSPGEKAIVAMRRSLYGVTDELRQENHAALLATSARDLQAAAGRLLESMAQSRVAVVAGSDAIAKASATLPDLAQNQTTLPL